MPLRVGKEVRCNARYGARNKDEIGIVRATRFATGSAMTRGSLGAIALLLVALPSRAVALGADDSIEYVVAWNVQERSRGAADSVLGDCLDSGPSPGERSEARFPSGREVSLCLSQQDRLRMGKREIEYVEIVELQSDLRERYAGARVFLVRSERKPIAFAREAWTNDSIAVRIDGRIVDIEPPGTSWMAWLPGGIISTLSDAERAFRWLPADRVRVFPLGTLPSPVKEDQGTEPVER